MGRDVVDRVWLLTDLVLPPNDLVDLVLLFIDRVLLLSESCRSANRSRANRSRSDNSDRVLLLSGSCR